MLDKGNMNYHVNRCAAGHKLNSNFLGLEKAYSGGNFP